MRRSVLKVLSGRDGEMFPCLEEALWGDAFSRYEIWCVCERKTGVKRIVDSYFTPKRRTVLPIDCFVPVPKKTPRNRTNRRHIPLSRQPLTAQLLLSPQHAHRTPQTHSRQLRRPRRHPPPIDHDTLQQVLRHHPALLTPPATRSTPAPSLASAPETPSGNRTASRTTESSSAPPTHLPPSSLAPSRRTREPTGRTGLRLNTTWSFNAEEGGKPLWSVWRRGEALRNPDTGAALEGSRWCSSTGR